MENKLELTLPLPEGEMETLEAAAADYAHMHGLVFGRKEGQPDTGYQVGLGLLPTSFPRAAFDQLKSVQPAYTQLYYRAAHDFRFQERCFETLAPLDEYVGGLWDIHRKVKDQPRSQHRCLCLFRNDFMLDVTTSPPQWKQIEMNTNDPHFSGLATRLKAYHTYMLRRLGYGAEVANRIPESAADEGGAEALLAAWRLYGNKKAVIMFLVDPHSPDPYDPCFFEHAIWRQSQEVTVVCHTFRDVIDRAELRDSNLVIDDLEVAVVYLATGNFGDDYPTGQHWSARLLLERSRAIKCPCIHVHLATCKKFQQALCEPGAMETYVSDPQTAASIRATFVRQFALDLTPAGEEAVQSALEAPENFVLKDQREGEGEAGWPWVAM